MRNGPPYSRPRAWPNFKADLRCYSPESHSLEEKKTICNKRLSTSKAVPDAMRTDFEQLQSEARSRLLDMLCRSGVEAPNGDGTSSSARVIRCIGSSVLSRHNGNPDARGQASRLTPFRLTTRADLNSGLTQ